MNIRRDRFALDAEEAYWIVFCSCSCCAAGEQQHNQDLREISKMGRTLIHHFLPECIAFNHTFYQSSLRHFFTRMHCARKANCKLMIIGFIDEQALQNYFFKTIIIEFYWKLYSINLFENQFD